MRISGIYKITNTISGKFYIGSASYCKSRFAKHRKGLRTNTHDNRHLQSSWNKHGESAFTFEIIESCPKENLIVREQYYIDTLNPTLNILRVAGSSIGYVPTKQTREKLSKIFKGRAPSNKGVPHSEETKKRLKEAWIRRKERPFDPAKYEEWKRKVSEGLKGIKRSEEHMEKLRGRKMPPHVREALQKAHIGRKASDESRRKMSESQKREILNRKRDVNGRILPTNA